MSEGRRTWPGPMSVAGVGPGHEHDLPSPLLARVRMLTRSVVIFGVCLAAIGTCLVLILLDRSNARDVQNTRTNQRINDAICDLLDQLPEGGLLQRPREKYGCGPGIPLSDLPPAVRDRYAPTPTPAPTLTPLPPPASPDAPRPAPGTLPPRTGPGPGGPTPAPSSEPTPLRPVTGLVCDVTGVCL